MCTYMWPLMPLRTVDLCHQSNPGICRGDKKTISSFPTTVLEASIAPIEGSPFRRNHEKDACRVGWMSKSCACYKTQFPEDAHDVPPDTTQLQDTVVPALGDPRREWPPAVYGHVINAPIDTCQR